MTDPERSIDDLLDALQDGHLDDRARSETLARIAADPELASQAELQRDIDQSIRRSFQPPPSVDLSFLAKARSELAQPTPADQPDDDARAELASPAASAWTRRRMVMLAIAACVAWFVVGSQVYRAIERNRDQVAFRQRPLTEIYNECVRDGFEPYWVCDDDALFASTFKTRQGTAVCLKDLPPNLAMVGLSYLAGISLESTSLLARAGDVPVIVFVDRLERDWNPPTGQFQDQGLNVTRRVRDGLVFYEVSPLAEPVFTAQLKLCE